MKLQVDQRYSANEGRLKETDYFDRSDDNQLLSI